MLDTVNLSPAEQLAAFVSEIETLAKKRYACLNSARIAVGQVAVRYPRVNRIWDMKTLTITAGTETPRTIVFQKAEINDGW